MKVQKSLKIIQANISKFLKYYLSKIEKFIYKPYNNIKLLHERLKGLDPELIGSEPGVALYSLFTRWLVVDIIIYGSMLSIVWTIFTGYTGILNLLINVIGFGLFRWLVLDCLSELKGRLKNG